MQASCTFRKFTTTIFGLSGFVSGDESQQVVAQYPKMCNPVTQDPYLYFLDISKGTKDFGLTRGEKVCPPPVPSSTANKNSSSHVILNT
jgi:hypothetical protein